MNDRNLTRLAGLKINIFKGILIFILALNVILEIYLPIDYVSYLRIFYLLMGLCIIMWWNSGRPKIERI